jgi:carboxypeptidase C (cathepsin A)
MKTVTAAAMAAMTLCALAARADDAKEAVAVSIATACQIDSTDSNKLKWMRMPAAEQSATQRRLSVGGKTVDYTATAGTLIVRDDDDKPIASIGYVAYTKNGARDPSRPIMFAFNGGPGSSSVWLHMGVLGPKRVVVSDLTPTGPAPFRAVDNEFGVLDKSDLVMIDPVGTGLSHAVCEKHDEDFWGVDPDVDSVSRFIAQYVSDNNRWSSPKYLLGESYGTTRAAAIVNYLRVRKSLTFNGVVLVSVATDIEALFEIAGNDRPYPVYLPAFASVAFYHKMLPSQPPQIAAFLEEVRRYAFGPYTLALMKGDSLTAAERDEVAEQMSRYIGLSSTYLKQANLRVSENMFVNELLKSQRKTVSRLDSRFVGPTMDPLQKYAEYDPSFSAIGAAFSAAFLDYYHGELKFGQGKTYNISNWSIGEKWTWGHKLTGSPTSQPIVNSGVDLAQALVQDPNLRVLILNGYYDLATPFSGTEYVVSHLGLPPGLESHIQMQYYEAGHMMYVHPASLKKMKGDIDAFISSTIR